MSDSAIQQVRPQINYAKIAEWQARRKATETPLDRTIREAIEPRLQITNGSDRFSG